MACHHPLPGWRTTTGELKLNKEPVNATEHLLIPCGGCLGCQSSKALAWALRCHLENQVHEHTAWTTLTFDPKYEPPTLSKRILQLFLKRFREYHRRQTNRTVRHFAAGEYGETNGRPHYHAILFGVNADLQRRAIQDLWGLGITKTYPITPAAINYVAGYTAKKIGWKIEHHGEHISPEGEPYTWQAPFTLKSTRPHGLGGHARQWPQSWRDYAIHNGHQVPVPRYLHDAWKQTATTEQIEQHEYQKYGKQIVKPNSQYHRAAAELQAIAKQQQKASKRPL